MTSSTETASPRYRELDAWPDEDVLAALWESQLAGVASVRPALPAIAAAATAAVARLRRGGRLAYAGAGTSGRIAAQDGAELTPTFDWPAGATVLLLAGGIAALSGSVEGAEDDTRAATAAVAAAAIGPGDVVVALAASGATPFTLAAAAAARSRGALTIGVANVPGSALLASVDHPILAATGAEPIAGSTRLAAGTAQKVVLNLFSTLVMVRLGRVHDGLMVDMQPRNAKLRLRAERMVARIARCRDDAARAALAASGGNVKRAVMIARGLDPARAEAALARHGGHLRGALEELASGEGPP